MAESRKPVAFVDLPPTDFPFHIEAIGHDDEVLWEETIEGPGALAVPGMPGKIKTVRITYPDGQVVET